MKPWFPFLLALATSAVFVSPSQAASTVTCHCFRDRSYDPGRKFAADDYIRATSFNTLLAVHYGIAKRSIVMAKMNGTSEADLVLSLDLSARTGRPRAEWVERRKQEGAWLPVYRTVAADSTLQLTNDPELAAKISRNAVAEYFGVAPSRLGRLLDAGLDLRGAVLALTLADVTGRRAGAFAYDIVHRKQSWGEIFHRQGLTPEEVGPLIERRKK